ncbi:hypothetical protein TREAZ_1626 [Leadbettera azotonutricia ZAS-9]|uniref:Uncharacterized protein n=1 Tax=Leadbettera azotonutricia (strain ATCC BAA-888 / DSM 13862 / ZAS-9) TaxID=545695 RepID=F5YDC9_LEAAZ|nr:hypothetical protein TREAZ_1626 [Leadbettera azotonutricia ZAS-9]
MNGPLAIPHLFLVFNLHFIASYNHNSPLRDIIHNYLTMKSHKHKKNEHE